MSERYIKAVLFDLGETVLLFGRVRTWEMFRRAAQTTYEYLRSCGVSVGSFRLYFWQNLLQLRFRRMLSNIRRRDFDALGLLKRVGAKKGIELSREQWQQLAWLWYEPLTKVARIEPETKQTLESLCRSGLRLGLLSNTFVNAYSLERHLEQLGLLELFTVRLYSCQFPYRKPDRRIFEQAIAKLGVAPQQIVYVGDRIDKDIRPALRLGMHAVLKRAYTNYGKRVPAGALWIDKLCQLPQLIHQLEAQLAGRPEPSQPQSHSPLCQR